MLEKLSGKNLVLERLKISDSESVYLAALSSKSEIAPWLSWLNANYSQKTCDEFIKLQKSNWDANLEYTFAIKAHSGEILGMIGLHVFDLQNDVASIGYWMNTKFTGKGLCTEALKLLVNNAFLVLNLIRIEVIIATNNFASQKVAKRSGANFEAVLKNRIRLNGMVVNAQVYAFYPIT